MALGERVEAWRRAGEMREFRGRQIYTFERAGEGPLVVLLHGFPSSSFDFRQVIERLEGRAILTFDFLGFGLSEKPRDHLYSLAWQADLVEELVRRAEPSGPVELVAHDMGTSVSTELFARDLEGESRIDIGRALLFNGSILLDRASPTLGQKLLRSPAGPLVARFSNERFFRRQFGSIFSPTHPLTDSEATDQWALLTHVGGNRIFHRLIHYMDERDRLTDRWHGAFRDWEGDLRLLWALLDPVATTNVLDGLRELRPGVPVTELPGIGHYPQLEVPELVARAITAT